MEKALYEIIRLFSFQKGLLTKELAELVGMDRKSLGPYRENLEKDNLIARDKGGHFPTFSFSRDLFFNTGMFGESFVPRVRQN